MARLSVTINEQPRTYALTERGLQLGRLEDNDIVLPDPTVSRKHARIELRGREAWVVDQGSSNGVFVNRLRVRESPLDDGDTVRVGPFELLFADRAAQSVVLDDSRYFPVNADGRAVGSGRLPKLSLDSQEFYRISKRLNGLLKGNELYEAVLEEALRLVPAQRGVLLLLRGAELVPMVVYPPTSGEVALSSTIARKALDGEAVLTRDAHMDFAGSQSVIAANIRSALCVPLITEGRAIGLIYLDSPGREQFNEAQRDLLAVIAFQAAISIERARLHEELRQQALLRQNLARFMSPNVARMVEQYVAQHGQLWEPQELTISVLFADVKGFTSLSEQLSPREVQDLLNEYLHEMTEVVFQHDGTLDKYVGDAIMALFGAPRLEAAHDGRDHAHQAVSAGLGMLAARERLMQKLDAAKVFSFRVGINTGPVYAGFFGTRQRMEYTVIGDAVNTAARLESAAEPNGILIGEATRAALGDAFAVQEMGELQLKGKAQRVRAYKVLGKTS